ncbi:MAG: GNAT family N-acetyltransferase [Rickettsiales bacterium]|nr:GNAT family N-acetyltransferase [Rickettsiales bacterium]
MNNKKEHQNSAKFYDVLHEIEPLTSNGIVIEFTNDQRYLAQYYKLRRISYESDRYMQGHFNRGYLDRFDHEADVLIARKGNTCIGGARVNYSFPENRQPLPTESSSFSFINAFPEFNLANKRYCEIHRVVVHPEFRDKMLAKAILWHIWKRSVELGLDYQFSPSIPVKTRLYNMLYKGIGLDIDIRKDVTICDKNYDNVEMWLMDLQIKKQSIYQATMNYLQSDPSLELAINLGSNV